MNLQCNKLKIYRKNPSKITLISLTLCENVLLPCVRIVCVCKTFSMGQSSVKWTARFGNRNEKNENDTYMLHAVCCMLALWCKILTLIVRYVKSMLQIVIVLPFSSLVKGFIDISQNVINVFITNKKNEWYKDCNSNWKSNFKIKELIGQFESFFLLRRLSFSSFIDFKHFK